MKKIISYSLWGKNPKYINGAIQNAIDCYPSWITRFYIDETITEDTIKELKDNNAEIVIKQKSDAYYGMFWRFEPLDDNTIDRFIVRDCDSRLSKRDYDAILEWEESGKEFHIIRDHPYHNVPICGGMWGATKNFINKINFNKELDNYLRSHPEHIFENSRGKYFNTDQRFLWNIIWPKIVNTHIAHIAKDMSMLKITGNEKYLLTENEDKTYIGQSL